MICSMSDRARFVRQARLSLRIQRLTAQVEALVPQIKRAQGGDDSVQTVKRDGKKVGRNDPCPCGSGKKYKKCHGQG